MFFFMAILIGISLFAKAQEIKRKNTPSTKTKIPARHYFKDLPYIMSTTEIDLVWDKFPELKNSLSKEKQLLKFGSGNLSGKIYLFRLAPSSTKPMPNILMDIIEWPGKKAFPDIDAHLVIGKNAINLPTKQISFQNYSFPKIIDGRIVLRIFNKAGDHFYLVISSSGDESYPTDVVIHMELMQ